MFRLKSITPRCYKIASKWEVFFEQRFFTFSSKNLIWILKSKIINNRIRGKARKSNSGCTKLVQIYNEDRNVDFQRLNYLVSNEKSIEEIKNNISYRKDNFQHQAYKKGCISLDGTPTAKVTLQTKREYEKMLNINIGKIFKNEYQP